MTNLLDIKKIRDFSSHYFGGLYTRIDEHHVFLNASGLAFELFLCIIPFLLIIFAVLGLILASNDIQYQINLLIDTIIPYEEYSEFVKKIIFTRINEVIEYKTMAGIIGGFGLFFAASGLFSSMRTILNQVLGITKSVSMILGKLRDFALVVMVILIFFLTTVCIPIIDVLGQSASQFKELEFFNAPIFHHVFLSLLSFTIIFIVFSTLYATVPIKKLRKRSIVVSALWAALLWEASKQLFGFYLYNFSSFGKIYGTYALVVVVAFWIYFSSVIFIIGAEIGQLFQERLEHKNLEKTISLTSSPN
jgi:membrane protein